MKDSNEIQLATLGFTIIRDLLKIYDPYEPKGFFSLSRSALSQKEKLLAGEVAFDLSQALHDFPSSEQEEIFTTVFERAVKNISKKISKNQLLKSVVNVDDLLSLSKSIEENKDLEEENVTFDSLADQAMIHGVGLRVERGLFKKQRFILEMKKIGDI